MSRIIVLIFGLSILYGTVCGQITYEFKGSVVDENNESLPGASVILYPIKKGTITDSSGNFMIEGLTHNQYEVEISSVGYQTLYDTIYIDQQENFKFQLQSSTVQLKAFEVTSNYAQTRKKEESLNIEIVNDDFLKQNMGGSLGNSLKRLPGISAIEIGSGQAKPQIRGLGFNRVVVVENNIKHEAQQWGEDHGLEVDQYNIEHLEIIKGPASLMYGSDAIGGIIKANNHLVPTKNTFGGKVDLTGKSNNDFLGGSVSLFGRKDWIFASLRTTILDYADYRVPTDSIDIYSYRAALHKNFLRNTSGSEKNFHATLGIIKKNLQSKIHLSLVNSKNGFFANAYGLEPRNVDTALHDRSNRDIQYPFQTVKHFKVTNNSSLNIGSLLFDLNLGYQKNVRQEVSEYKQHGYMPATFPEHLDYSPDLERLFDKDVFSGSFGLRYRVSESTKLNVGINSELQNNRIGGHGFIIPEFTQIQMGSFLLLKHQFSEKSQLLAGLRYDYGKIHTTEYRDWFESPVLIDGDTEMEELIRAKAIDRSFSNFTWSLGYNYHPGNWTYKINIGKSFRMPIAKELAANGVNRHRFRFEVGNSKLSPEISYQLDVGMEFNGARFELGLSPFVNYFSNYIYLNPTADHDRFYGDGNQVFEYIQSEVFRYGSELFATYKLNKSLELGLVGEYVYSRQLSGPKKGFTLPFSPAPSGIINLKYQRDFLSFIKSTYLSIDFKVTAAQNNIVPTEVATASSQIFSMGIGGNLHMKSQQISISMQVNNLLNTKYFNHTSYYRLINVPEAGRNFVINISIPFSGKIKK